MDVNSTEIIFRVLDTIKNAIEAEKTITIKATDITINGSDITINEPEITIES